METVQTHTMVDRNESATVLGEARRNVLEAEEDTATAETAETTDRQPNEEILSPVTTIINVEEPREAEDILATRTGSTRTQDRRSGSMTTEDVDGRLPLQQNRTRIKFYKYLGLVSNSGR